MSRKTYILVASMAASLLSDLVCAQESSPERVRRFATLPDWTGLWETEAAARLLSTGKFEAPQLWRKPPLNPEWEKKTGHAQSAPPATDLPDAVKVCAPQGFPAVMEYPVADLMFELLVTPEQTLLVSTEGVVRHIYTDGRSHPKAEDLWPTPEGHSIGRWEGDTLVIDTVARKAGPVGPVTGAADLSASARFTERLRRLNADTMQNDMTIDDPERFSQPWKFSIRYTRAQGVERMIAVNCAENDRNPVVNGALVIAPP